MAYYAVRSLGPTKINMTKSKAMAILEFPAGKNLQDTTFEEIQEAFTKKVQKEEEKNELRLLQRRKNLSSTTNQAQGKKITHNKQEELCKINEAYQFLLKLRRNLDVKLQKLEGITLFFALKFLRVPKWQLLVAYFFAPNLAQHFG